MTYLTWGLNRRIPSGYRVDTVWILCGYRVDPVWIHELLLLANSVSIYWGVLSEESLVKLISDTFLGCVTADNTHFPPTQIKTQNNNPTTAPQQRSRSGLWHVIGSHVETFWKFVTLFCFVRKIWYWRKYLWLKWIRRLNDYVPIHPVYSSSL